MNPSSIVDPFSQTFGLPPCLRVPIAATDIGTIETYVGRIVDSVESRRGEKQAFYVQPHIVGKPTNVQAPLWKHVGSDVFVRRLYPEFQVWVHVDYRRYRNAYLRFGMPPISKDYVLDHIQNREAVRLRWYTHPYLRLCPVSRVVNTSSGHKTGCEGIAKESTRRALQLAAKSDELRKHVTSFRVVYADPIDLTKMLDIPTGTKALAGVGDRLKWFYPD